MEWWLMISMEMMMIDKTIDYGNMKIIWMDEILAGDTGTIKAVVEAWYAMGLIQIRRDDESLQKDEWYADEWEW